MSKFSSAGCRGAKQVRSSPTPKGPAGAAAQFFLLDVIEEEETNEARAQQQTITASSTPSYEMLQPIVASAGRPSEGNLKSDNSDGKNSPTKVSTPTDEKTDQANQLRDQLENIGDMEPHPHVLGRHRVPWGLAPGRWCGPSRVHPGREGGKLENAAKIVSAARVVQAAVPSHLCHLCG